MKINYHNLCFKAVENTDNGETSEETVFHYQQQDNILMGDYEGGNILKGTLIGIVNEDGSLQFRYHQINKDNQIRSGECFSIPEVLSDGRIRLHEKWRWVIDAEDAGTSIVEQIIK